MSALRLVAASATDPGRVRAVNEDKAVVAEDLVAVADGMGGHAGGEVAARTAIETLRRSFGRNKSAKGLLDAVEQANRAVYDQSVNDRSLRGMGTTLTAAAMVHQRSGDRVVIVNVGDSRAYLLDGSGFSRLTEDHSLVEEMVRRGELTPEEAAVHPHRHIVTRALGIDEEIEVDAWELEPQVGARLLLCSDGLTNEVEDGELAEILAERLPAAQTARELVDRALVHGGSDNVTVIVVDLLADGERRDGAAVPDAVAADGAAAGPPGEATAPGTGAAPGTDSAAGSLEGADPAGAAGIAALAGQSASESGAAAGEPPTAAQPAATSKPAASPASRPGTLPERGARAGGQTTVRAIGSTGRRSDDTTMVALAGAGKPARTPVRAVLPGPRVVLPGAGASVPARAVVRVRHERIMTLRVAVFVLLLVGVLGGAGGFVGWFVKASYFVGVVDGHVAILEGRPGGFLWFKPTLVERTTLAESSVFPPTRSYLEAGMEQPSLAAAKRVVAQLANGSAYLALPTGSTRQADGIPTGSTLVPISSPVATAATLPPVASTVPPVTTVPAARGKGTTPRRTAGGSAGGSVGKTAAPGGVAGAAALAGAAAAAAATPPTGTAGTGGAAGTRTATPSSVAAGAAGAATGRPAGPGRT